MAEQTIQIAPVLEFFGLLLTIIISSIVIAGRIKKGYQAYIDNKLKVVNMEISNIKKDISDNETQNEKEHDRLTTLFDKIDSKLDRVIENQKKAS